jgi:hypothetical protein
VFLHRTKNGRWFKEHRYEKAKWRSFCYEIRAESAVWWLIEEEQEIPPDCEHLDDRVDVGKEDFPGEIPRVENYCLNCMRQSRTKWNREMGEYELLILDCLADGSTKVGRVIAEETGLYFNSHLRSVLARLVACHVLENVGKRRGYRRREEICPDTTT